MLGMEAARGARGLECMEAQDGDMWDRERGFGNAVRGEGRPEEKRPHQGKLVANLLLVAKIITVWEQSVEIVAK